MPKSTQTPIGNHRKIRSSFYSGEEGQLLETPEPSLFVAISCDRVRNALVHDDNLGMAIFRFSERDGHELLSRIGSNLPRVNEFMRRIDQFKFSADPYHTSVRKPIPNPVMATDS